MTRSYRRFALAAILLLTLHQTLGELQRAATVAKSIGKARSESSPRVAQGHGSNERPERVRAQLAGGFIDDATVHKNGGAAQRRPHASGTDHPRSRAPSAAGSRRKMPVHGTSGPIHTYIKTDKNANFKWGVRHFVGAKYAR
ncbi:uncharacterized protein LOC120897463 [Anopheles arabiensis]|nr:uncharacterized protein LOC120897463 [Anopheles arabiensis]